MVHRVGKEGRQSYRPAAPIQRFNNKSLNWPAWFRHFRAVADVHDWDKNQRALQLVSYLDETAMNVSQELGDDELYDYDILVKLFRQMFALARRMGYEMQPIARRANQPPGSPRTPFASGQGYRPPFRQGCDFSKLKCFSCGQMGHMQARCPKPDSALPFKPPGWNMQSDGQQQRNTNLPPGNAI